jgi:hypothetical protein
VRRQARRLEGLERELAELRDETRTSARESQAQTRQAGSQAREAHRLGTEGARAIESLLEVEVRHAQRLDVIEGAGR